MPRRYRPYTPPPLMKRVWLRNPDEKPDEVDEFETDFAQQHGLGRIVWPAVPGGEVAWPGVESPLEWPGLGWVWGAIVWGQRFDQRANFSPEEGVPVFESVSTWTIRHRAGIAANAEIVHGGLIYEAQGEPLERGGPTGRRAARVLGSRDEVEAVMAGLLDDPAAPVQIELAQIVRGECADKQTAYETVHRLQERVDELLRSEFPDLEVTLSAATYGDADAFDRENP